MPTSGPGVAHGGAFEPLTATRLSMVRGGRRLFADVSFELVAGDMLLLLGPNGSGKSSLLRGMLGLSPLARGELRVGLAPRPVSGHALCRHTLYQGHAHGAKGELTAMENVALAAVLDGAPGGPGALEAALRRVGLERHRDIEVRRLSQGQKQRLQLARFALNLGARTRLLWLMDEPSAALDAQGAELLRELLAAHAARGGAAMVATHLPVQADGARVRELRLDAYRVPASAVAA